MTIEEALDWVEKCDIIPQSAKDELAAHIAARKANYEVVCRNFGELRLAARRMVNAMTVRGLFDEPVFSRFAGDFRLFETVLVRQEKDFGIPQEVHSNEK